MNLYFTIAADKLIANDRSLVPFCRLMYQQWFNLVMEKHACSKIKAVERALIE